ncbi:MAG: 50S ribosomal protein L6 [Clostridiales bacterium]|jgi:large subunit ribosomal protein L6|nr:50S ribosomal protein L6 [Clostridiales bacterium]
MSRIGRAPISVPAGVDVKNENNLITVKGPKGELVKQYSKEMKIEIADGQITVSRPSDKKEHRALHGLTRTLIANMVEGVVSGFKKELEIEGVGYRAAKQGNNLVLNVGYSHQVFIAERDGVTIDVPQPTKIIVNGIDKQAVGQIAAEIRKVRPPEPYKGKGIRYAGERIIRKEGKAGKGS